MPQSAEEKIRRAIRRDINKRRAEPRPEKAAGSPFVLEPLPFLSARKLAKAQRLDKVDRTTITDSGKVVVEPLKIPKRKTGRCIWDMMDEELAELFEQARLADTAEEDFAPLPPLEKE